MPSSGFLALRCIPAHNSIKMLFSAMLLPVSAAFIINAGVGGVSVSQNTAKSSAFLSSANGISNKLHRRPSAQLRMSFITHYEEITVPTGRTVSFVDITNTIRGIVSKCVCKEGVVTILSKHSTVSVTINEMEGRLVDDTRQFLLKLAPPYAPYLHNDLDFRSLHARVHFHGS